MDQKLASVEELALLIQTAARLMHKLPENLQEAYHPEIKTLIDEYNAELTLLKKEMEDYFERERKSGEPVNLSLRRAYEALKFL